MIRHATGTDISADFGESQIIADPAIALTSSAWPRCAGRFGGCPRERFSSRESSIWAAATSKAMK